MVLNIIRLRSDSANTPERSLRHVQLCSLPGLMLSRTLPNMDYKVSFGTNSSIPDVRLALGAERLKFPWQSRVKSNRQCLCHLFWAKRLHFIMRIQRILLCLVLIVPQAICSYSSLSGKDSVTDTQSVYPSVHLRDPVNLNNLWKILHLQMKSNWCLSRLYLLHFLWSPPHNKTN